MKLDIGEAMVMAEASEDFYSFTTGFTIYLKKVLLIVLGENKSLPTLERVL